MPLKTLADEQPGLNLTSMIDVMFLLVIFFMVGSNFSDPERNLSVKVPQVSTDGPLAPAPEKRVIGVHKDGEVTLDGRTVTLEQLRSTLQDSVRAYRHLGVIVRGDGEGDFQHVAQVLAAVRAAGVSDVGISVRIAGKESPLR